MRARIVEIMECWPVVLRLKLQDGQIGDFDTTEGCQVTASGETIDMNQLQPGIEADFTLLEGLIAAIVVSDSG